MDREKLFTDNIGLAVSTADRMCKLYSGTVERKLLTRSDLVQIAMERMWKCCERYDESKGVKFSTYAVSSMQNEIIHTLERYNRIKLPRKDSTAINTKNEEEITMLRNGYISYLQFRFNDEEIDSLEMIEDIEDYGLVEMKLIIKSTLDKEEMKLLNAKLKGLNQTEIGEMLGVTQMTISRRLSQIKEKLKLELAV